MIWSISKSFMNWSSPGPPRQLEIKSEKGLKLLTKARDIAKTMNEYFISKVQNIVKGLRVLPINLTGCKKIMEGKKVTVGLEFVTVQRVKKLLSQLKNKKSISIDQLDNFSVKLASDYLAEPLHHVISLSIIQQNFQVAGS